MIIIDSREASKNKYVVDGLRSFGVDVRVEKLPVGDYFVAGEALVERKEAVDLAHSLRSRRLWNELLKMVDVEDNVERWLLIEGSLSLIEKFTSFNPNSIVSAILAVSDMGFKVFFTPSRRWTTIFLYRLEKKYGEKKKKIHPLRVKEKDMTLPEIQRCVLEGIPQIGPRHAIELLKYFKTLRRIAKAEVEDLMRVPGFGRKRAEIIYKVFNTEYNVDE